MVPVTDVQSFSQGLKSCWLPGNEHSCYHYESFTLFFRALIVSSSMLGRNNKVTSIVLGSTPPPPTPPRHSPLRFPPHPVLNPPRDRSCNPIKSTLGAKWIAADLISRWRRLARWMGGWRLGRRGEKWGGRRVSAFDPPMSWRWRALAVELAEGCMDGDSVWNCLF